MRRLVLKSFQSPGDTLMLTAAIRDLHQAHPGEFQTDIRTSAESLWDNNPYLTALEEGAGGVDTLDMHYPLIHHSNQRPYHFIHGYVQYLEEKLGVRIPVTSFRGDIHLADAEKHLPDSLASMAVPRRFWIVIGGGKRDFTAKWWDPACFQEVVDHFRDRLAFVQCGAEEDWHPPLSGVTNLVGKTSVREFVRIMYHAEGVLCPVTFAMHLAAAVDTKPDRPPLRPCVVVAGSREPPHWEAYPHHQFLSTLGSLPCCRDEACWRSRCQRMNDGDEKDAHNLCERPVQTRAGVRIPECMALITPFDVIRKIEMYLKGWEPGAGQSLGAPRTSDIVMQPNSKLDEPAGRRNCLTIAGNTVPFSADYCLRWVEIPGKAAQPVIYYRGKRITQAWAIDLAESCYFDPVGDNANTCVTPGR